MQSPPFQKVSSCMLSWAIHRVGVQKPELVLPLTSSSTIGNPYSLIPDLLKSLAKVLLLQQHRIRSSISPFPLLQGVSRVKACEVFQTFKVLWLSSSNSYSCLLIFTCGSRSIGSIVIILSNTTSIIHNTSSFPACFY